MVWGMENIGSGMFFPSGDFPGEDARLEAIEQSMPPEKRSKYSPLGYVSHVAECIRKDKGPLADHELPKKFVASPRPKELGSLLKLRGGVRAVDEDLKNIIERLEPSVHQFWPLQIVMPNGDGHPNRYYGMMVLRHLDSFMPEQSDPDCWRGGEIAPGINSYTVYGSSREDHAGLAMASSVFGSSHLWRERALMNPTLFFSDELQAAIKSAGLRIPKHFKLKVI